MNWMILTAGIVALMTVGGHFAIGAKQFLQPMLDADFDRIPKKVMLCVFHYVSAFLILSAAVLLAAGAGIGLGGDATVAVRFIGVTYLLFGVWQVGIALASGIPGGVFKLFQWVFFVLIAGFALAGTYG